MRDKDMVHEHYMREALKAAKEAAERSEIPVGAVVVKDGQIIAAAGNRRETWRDPTAHAEMIALREAARALSTWRLSGCTLYVTLEPCPMCVGAIALARPDAVIFGADDPKSGCCGSVYRLTEDPALHLGAVPAFGGVLAEECAALLIEFFQKKEKRL